MEKNVPRQHKHLSPVSQRKIINREHISSPTHEFSICLLHVLHFPKLNDSDLPLQRNSITYWLKWDWALMCASSCVPFAVLPWVKVAVSLQPESPRFLVIKSESWYSLHRITTQVSAKWHAHTQTYYCNYAFNNILYLELGKCVDYVEWTANVLWVI